MNPRAIVSAPLVRVRCAVDPHYVEAIRSRFGEDGQKRLVVDVRRRLEEAYGCGTATAAQDPSDGMVVALLFGVTRTPAKPDPIVVPVAAELVDAPHVKSPAKGDEHRRWDPGLVPAEAWTIERALAVEDEPNHLCGFATTLEPFFPVAASSLRRRAVEVERTKPGYRRSPVRLSTPIGAAAGAIPALRSNLLRFASHEGIRPELLEVEAKRVACILAEDPPGRDRILARFPAEVQRLGSAMVERVDDEILVAVPSRVALACPPSGREGFVSPSALMLTLSSTKPVASRVGNMSRAQSLIARFESDADTKRVDEDVLRARAAMESAQRAIERRRWVEWYTRTYYEEDAA